MTDAGFERFDKASHLSGGFYISAKQDEPNGVMLCKKKDFFV
jgi:hypothetical protein